MIYDGEEIMIDKKLKWVVYLLVPFYAFPIAFTSFTEMGNIILQIIGFSLFWFSFFIFLFVAGTEAYEIDMRKAKK